MIALPLDVTHKMVLNPDKVKELVGASGRLSKTLDSMMALWDRGDVERYGSRAVPLHDPLVIVYLLRPDLFHTRPARLFVNCQNETLMGQTIADWYGKTGLPANAHIVTQVDGEGVFQFLLQKLRHYEGTTP